MHLDQLIHPDLLRQMKVDRFVSIQRHPVLPLSIGNYTETAVYKKVWNDATLNCRGLIWDDEGRIVARPYPKFFNYGDEENTGALRWDVPVEVSDKLDGSLGIIYPTAAGPAVATRGSFTSPQALHATERLRELYPDWTVPEGWTVLVEIIYPDNRIVLDYADTDDLVMHGAVFINNGATYGPQELRADFWPGPTAAVMSAKTLGEALSLPARDNAEGVVVRYFDTNQMVKIKQADYVALHRIVTNASARVLWNYLAVHAVRAENPELEVGKMVSRLHLDPAVIADVLETGPAWEEKFLAGVPDEFYAWVRFTVAALKARARDTSREASLAANTLRVKHGTDRAARKTIAAEVAAAYPRDMRGLIYAVLDGHSITAQSWVANYPGDERPFAQSEAAA